MSANRKERGSHPLKFAQLPTPRKLGEINVNAAASQWVDSINAVIKDFDATKFLDLFLRNFYWRDQLCLSWDLRTIQSAESLHKILDTKSGLRIRSLALDTSSKTRSPSVSALDTDSECVGAFLKVETDVGSGVGFVRLVPDGDAWKAFTLFTCLETLRGHPEKTGVSRPYGVRDGVDRDGQNWLERRRDEDKLEAESELPVLIIGAGQAGLTVAARLKTLGVKALIIDTVKSVGDSWRNRYHHLVLHDPVWYDHLPYLPFPTTWPIFTPKDKLGDWFEFYAKVMELSIWTETTLENAKWSDGERSWTVVLNKAGTDGISSSKTFSVRHIIQATGASGEPNFPNLPGLDSFSGPKITHSSQFKGATSSRDQKRKVIVVGSCNSGHDIAQDLYNNGYEVTMIQRSTTCVVGVETMRDTLSGLYGEGSPSTEDADVLFHGIPNSLMKVMNLAATKTQNKSDENILIGLAQAGFALDNGPDETGLWLKYLQRGGGYYLDVGGSQLIIDGKIKLKHGNVTEVVPTGLKLEDGHILEADEVVFATGYLNMRTQTAKIFGPEVADRVKDVWGFDEEGEIRTMWRKSGHPGLWMMGGNLALCRWYSRLLALQIKGLEEGFHDA